MAISGAGATALELAYLGVPSILIPLSPDQESVARGLSELGAAIFVNPDNPGFGVEISKTVLALAREEKKRAEMSNFGRNIVDGFGGNRVADEIIAVSR